MSRTHNTTTAIRIILASVIVASGIGATTLGAAGPDAQTAAAASVTTTAPARQESIEIETAGITETTIHAETQQQHEEIEWALGRYAEAGLELPAIEIHLHSDRADCNGLNGYLANAVGGGWILHSCGVDYTLLHELAHAYDNHMLDDATRDELLELAHADSWRHDDWHLAGGEHAANVIAWGLMEERINQTRTRPYDYQSMLEAYSILTGGGQPLWMDA